MAPSPRQGEDRPTTQRKTEKERQLAYGRGVEGGRGGAKSNEHKKAWSSINLQFNAATFTFYTLEVSQTLQVYV